MRLRYLCVAALLVWVACPSWAEPSAVQKSGALFQMKCAKCHTIGKGDRVGPDLKGVELRHEKDWIVAFIQHPGAYLDKDPAAKKLLEQFHGVRMEETGVSQPEAEGLLEYIKAAASGPAAPEGPAALPEDPLYQKLKMPDEQNTVSWPGLGLVFLLLAGAVVLWQAGAHAPSVALIFVVSLTGYWTFGGRRYFHLLGNQQGYEPRQPVAYSHAKHAGQLGIPCLYCHYGAQRSDVAGVPAVSVCMNCHNAVKRVAGAAQDSPEIARLAAYWETRTSSAPVSIPWIRIHQLPDFVHFSHRAHVADNLQCQECHGPVQTMERMRQASSLSMGWCVSCHRTEGGKAPTHWKRAGGPLDCAACHW